ncbi:MAG: hypothetical protein ACXWAV_01370, partial [Chthoniobacterales bacterium]
MRLEEPADVERWQRAADDALQTLEFKTPVSIETPVVDINAHLDAEMNRPFAAKDLPLRFFAIGRWFGVVIDHWLADDFSLRALLHRIYSSYHSEELPPLHWANVHPPTRSRLSEWNSFIRQAITLRRASRFPLVDPLDFRVGTFRKELAPSALDAIRDLAKKQNATVHDVFLAATAQTLAVSRPPLSGDRRDAVALASAIDLRRFEGDEAKTGFGFLISQYAVVERQPEKILFAELIARISAQTR